MKNEGENNSEEPEIRVEYNPETDSYQQTSKKKRKRRQYIDRYWLHALLVLITFFTTCMAGAEHVTNKRWFMTGGPENALNWGDLWNGLPYSIAFMAFLLTHEFGHYFASRWHKVKCSLPYAIPVFIPFFFLNIGSFGAVIRIREKPDSTKKYFDIGIAGPLAGFVIALAVLIIGFLTLPPLDYLHQMNPNYLEDFGHIPSESELLAKYGGGLKLGNSLIFWFLESTIADPARMPSHYELIHYPLLFAGFLTLFFTALNLLPIGQLDGGHVTYGLFGAKRAGIFSRVAIIALILYGGLGMLNFYEEGWATWLGIYLLYLFLLIPKLFKNDIRVSAAVITGIILVQQVLQRWVLQEEDMMVNPLWLFYAFLATRVIKPDHPRADKERPLSTGRKILGWVALAIFILCFTPEPLSLEVLETPTKQAALQSVAQLFPATG